jgi:hypothetical protein
VVKTFGFSHEYVLKMPVKRFWFYTKQVDRLAADEDLRMLSLLGAVTSSEGYKQRFDYLTKAVGEISVLMPEDPVFNLDEDGQPVDTSEMDPEFDRAAFHAFKEKLASQARTIRVSKD